MLIHYQKLFSFLITKRKIIRVSYHWDISVLNRIKDKESSKDESTNQWYLCVLPSRTISRKRKWNTVCHFVTIAWTCIDVNVRQEQHIMECFTSPQNWQHHTCNDENVWSREMLNKCLVAHQNLTTPLVHWHERLIRAAAKYMLHISRMYTGSIDTNVWSWQQLMEGFHHLSLGVAFPVWKVLSRGQQYEGFHQQSS